MHSHFWCIRWAAFTLQGDCQSITPTERKNTFTATDTWSEICICFVCGWTANWRLSHEEVWWCCWAWYTVICVKINQSLKQAAFVPLNTHFLFICSCQIVVKKLLYCMGLNRLISEVAVGETRFVLLWALSVSSCYSWLSARWAGVSGLSVCILVGCGDCRLCCFFSPFFFFIWGDEAPVVQEYEWWLLVWIHILYLYLVSLCSVQQSFFVLTMWQMNLTLYSNFVFNCQCN